MSFNATNLDTGDELGYSANELRMFKSGCLDSTLFAARVFFKRRDQEKFIVNRHHKIIADTLDRVIEGKIKRLIVNIPPGYTKTELVVIFFILRGLMVNPRAKFIHTSYSGDLALLNSGIVKDMIQEPLYQALNPLTLKWDTKAKARWYTHRGGGVMAVAQGGQVTVFRAGRMTRGEFNGALIIDDPIKPEEAFSKTIRERTNRTYTTTIKNRLAIEDVPIILIMQRLHEDDLAGFLLKGGSGEIWHHLEIPAFIGQNTSYPKEWTHGKRIPYLLPVGPLWPHKHTYDELKALKGTSSYVWSCQYMQRPTDISGTIFKRDWFPLYREYDPVNCWVVLMNGEKVKIQEINSYSDTALKPGEENDWTVFQTWGLGEDGRIYLLERIRGKWDSVDLETNFVRYLRRLRFIANVNNLGPSEIGVEDKASGIGLVQAINKMIGTCDYTNRVGEKVDLTGLPSITAIPRGPTQNKVARAMSAAPFAERGEVVLPESAPWLEVWLDEVCSFSGNMTHSHDDQCDPFFDAVQRMLIEPQIVDYSKVVGQN